MITIVLSISYSVFSLLKRKFCGYKYEKAPLQILWIQIQRKHRFLMKFCGYKCKESKIFITEQQFLWIQRRYNYLFNETRDDNRLLLYKSSILILQMG